MKLTAQIKLVTNQEQTALLLTTLRRVNEACNFASEYAWEHRIFRQFQLQKETYYQIKSEFGLTAQAAVQCVKKVVDAYKLDRECKREFKLYGSISYDDRILSWDLAKQTVSIWTLEGRIKLPFQVGNRQLAMLASRQGETDLVYRDGNFYLFATCNMEEPLPDEVEEHLGVDLGIKNIATDSDGAIYSGGQVNGLRKRHAKLRQKLQKKGTKAAKRLLKKRRRKESRFAKNVNHIISKRLVEKAKGTNRGIALEDLKGIRDRITVRRSQRRQHHSWSFHDLRTKLEYKARLAGVPIALVDPRNTSRTCIKCGSIDKKNRPSQAVFCCVSCGFSGHADTIAARNISHRADIASRVAVNQPDISTLSA